jgi:isopentenyl-diphosphate delta-isomerase
MLQQRTSHINTIPRYFGQTLVAVIRERENHQAGSRRLFEMGFKTDLKSFHFIYKAPFDNGGMEHGSIICNRLYDENQR